MLHIIAHMLIHEEITDICHICHQHMSKLCYICYILTLSCQNLKMEVGTHSQVLAPALATSTLSKRCSVFTQALLVAFPFQVCARGVKTDPSDLLSSDWCDVLDSETKHRAVDRLLALASFRVRSRQSRDCICLAYGADACRWRARPLPRTGTPSHRRCGCVLIGGPIGQIHLGVGCDLLTWCFPRSLQRIWVARFRSGLPPSGSGLPPSPRVLSQFPAAVRAAT